MYTPQPPQPFGVCVCACMVTKKTMADHAANHDRLDVQGAKEDLRTFQKFEVKAKKILKLAKPMEK